MPLFSGAILEKSVGGFYMVDVTQLNCKRFPETSETPLKPPMVFIGFYGNLI